TLSPGSRCTAGCVQIPCSGCPAADWPSQVQGGDQLPLDGSTIWPSNSVSRITIGPSWASVPALVTVIVNGQLWPPVVASQAPTVFVIERFVSVSSGGVVRPRSQNFVPCSSKGANLASAKAVSSPAFVFFGVPPSGRKISALFL